MKNKPILVIMAAGMGSRYGGLKQLDPLGPNGEVILDYSLRDAHKAGFRTVVFIIKEAIKDDFMDVVYDRASKLMDVRLAFQEVDKVPEGIKFDTDREKPWGTAHAIYCAKDVIDGPFMVINADDFYGFEAFEKMYQFLETVKPGESAMMGYQLRNTLSENGTVSRGICEVDKNNKLTDIVELLKVTEQNGQMGYIDEDEKFHPLPEETIVSMNAWGFSSDFMDDLYRAFPKMLEKLLQENPEKGELYLPMAVKELVLDQDKDVEVLTCQEKWYGITYPEDKPTVMAALKKMHDEGKY